MSFIIRIELASNVMADFNVLHQAMASKGFSQTIKSDGNTEYHLPRATYSVKTSSARSQVLASAKQAVAQTGKTAEILVVEYSGCSWDGLKPVK
jgi:environmental stress-induced protein Ves